MKKAISLVLSLLMLATLFVPVYAAGDVNQVLSGNVLNSITEEEETGMGVAFLYTMSVKDVAIIGNRTYKSGTVTIGGADYSLVKMGAVVSNQAETGTDAEAMVLENVTGKRLLNVEATKLWDGWTDTQIQYAVRITNVPTTHKKTQLYSRPYYIYEDASGEKVTVYGDITNKSYFAGWCDANPIELPAIGSDIDVTKKKNRIRVSDATQTVTEEGNRQVTLTFRNYTSNWITEETDYVRYTCYDANGTVLDANPNSSVKYGTIYIGCIDTKKNKVKSFDFEVPDDTAKVAITYSKIVYWTEWA